MSFEPPSPSDDAFVDDAPDRVELVWEKSPGYAGPNSETKDAVIGLASALVVIGLMMAFIFAIVAAGVAVTAAVIIGMALFFGGGLCAAVAYERWKANFASPMLVIPSAIYPGDALKIEVHGNEEAIERCEIVATRTTTSRDSEGTLRKRSDRVWHRELDVVQGPNDNGSTRFTGAMSDRKFDRRTKWFIAVHLRHLGYGRSLRYVRPFRIQVRSTDAT